MPFVLETKPEVLVFSAILFRGQFTLNKLLHVISYAKSSILSRLSHWATPIGIHHQFPATPPSVVPRSLFFKISQAMVENISWRQKPKSGTLII